MSTSTPGGRFGASPAEPGPPLRALIDVPLRFQVTPEVAEALQGLQAGMRQTPPEGDWHAHYVRAIEIAEQIVKVTDGRLEELQRKLMTAEDPAEMRQRLAQGPRKEAERARSEAKAGAQRAAKEWSERSRRQLDHVLGQCVESAQKLLEAREEASDSGLVIRVEPTSFAQLSGYVARCADEWTKNIVAGAEKSLAEAVTGPTAALAMQAGRAPAAPRAEDPPANEARLGGELPVKEAEIASTGGALMGFVRANIMAVGMFGTVIGAVIYLVGMLSNPGEGQRPSSSSMLLRGGLILAVLPITLALGLGTAKKQRAAQREKALTAHKQAVGQFAKTEIERALEKHRRGLERWITVRAEAWALAVDGWWGEAVEPKLAEADAKATEATRELRLQQTKLGEDQTALRTFRGQLAQNLMFDLKKRLRELEEARRG